MWSHDYLLEGTCTTTKTTTFVAVGEKEERNQQMHQNWGTADDGGEECRWSALQQKQPAAEQSTTRAQNCAHARCAAEMQIEHAALCLQTRYATRASSSNRRQRAIKFWIWKRKTCVLRTKAGCLRQQQHYPRGRCTVDPDGPTTFDVAVTWERQIKSVCGPKLSASSCRERARLELHRPLHHVEQQQQQQQQQQQRFLAAQWSKQHHKCY